MQNISKTKSNQILSELRYFLGDWANRENAIKGVRLWVALEDDEMAESRDNPKWTYLQILLTLSDTISTKILIKTRLGRPRYIELGETGDYVEMSKESLFEALLIHNGILN